MDSECRLEKALKCWWHFDHKIDKKLLNMKARCLPLNQPSSDDKSLIVSTSKTKDTKKILHFIMKYIEKSKKRTFYF